jgi:hypothetical protein
MKNNVARFARSVDDFPCAVSLGGRLPAWELRRWGSRRNETVTPEASLRFTPSGEDDFSVRGDSKTVLYKGKNVSHRWTLLGKDNFEYDVILKKLPASNVISLTLEGAEKFDFFRQPDFVSNPFLRGSYAVYLKETLIGQGTGKLCHIHRPKIIDASGASVWGGLNVRDDKLLITIPESFIASAVYPVVVDPVIGMSTVGAFTAWDPWDDEEEDMRFAEQIPVNKYTAAQTLKGNCTGYFYDRYKYRSSSWQSNDFPAAYTDYNNKPKYKRTSGDDSLYYPATNGNPAGWLNADFTVTDDIAAGSSFWFGLYAEDGWRACYDYGGNLYAGMIDYDSGAAHAVYPDGDYAIRQNIKLSMYFEYSNSQNFVRTITQGVTLSDSFSVKSGYNRVIYSGVNAVQSTAKASLLFIRRIADNAAALFIIARSASLKRFISDTALSLSGGVRGSLSFICKIIETAAACCTLSRRLEVVVRIITLAAVRDFIVRRFLLASANLVIKSKITREIVIESKIK